MIIPVAGRSADSQAKRDAKLAKLQLDFPDMPQILVDAIASVPRSSFVSSFARHRAYDDNSLPIGSGQSAIKLSDIAYVFTMLKIQPTDNALEIGAGTGYTAILLAHLCKQVYSIEIIEYLAEVARQNVKKQNLNNVRIRNANGLEGWPVFAPFDVILITASITAIPDTLIDQLVEGGRIAAPILDEYGDSTWIIYTWDGAELIPMGRKRSNIPPIIQDE